MAFRRTEVQTVVRWLMSLLAVWAVAGWSAVAAARDLSEINALPATPGAATEQYAINFATFGRPDGMALRGVDGRLALNFGVRADEFVRRLQLDVNFSYSPALIKPLSHLNVFLNGTVVKTIKLPEREIAGFKQLVDLPVELLQPWNRLELQLIGHYTMDCEDPFHPDLWLTVGADSRLVFDVQPVQWPDELRLLPRPFFDERDIRKVQSTLVIPQPGNATLEAAGMVASWLGGLAGFRGTEFSVSGVLPEKGNGIVLLTAEDSFVSLARGELAGPQVTIVPNPNDSAGRLLLIAGRTPAELKEATRAVVLGSDTLVGRQAVVANLETPRPRKPYDAPKWLPTDRAVRFGELLPVADMTVSGHVPDPIEFTLRLPPDLFDWKQRGVPLELLYRYTPGAFIEDSLLTVSVNHQPVRTLKLDVLRSNVRRARSTWQEASAIRDELSLPLAQFGSLASMQYQFLYPYPVQTDCRGSIVDSRRSAIDPESNIDFSRFSHFKAMPDLAAFVTSGYPFTRMADLSETAVVLSDSPTSADYLAYLMLMARMGEATGYPVTGVTVARNPDPKELEGKDVLLLDTSASGDLMDAWKKHWPKRTAQGGAVELLGFESPVTRRRSVVVLAGGTAGELPVVLEEALYGDTENEVQGNAVSLRQGQIQSLSRKTSYYVGTLGFFRGVLWFFSSQPWALLLIYFLGAVLVAVIVYLTLQARARRRLQIK